MDTQVLKGHLEGMLLAIVASGPTHGYAAIEELKRRSGGTFALPEGTVYPVLHRLERDGLLSSRWTRNAGHPRRIYSLTARGRAELERRRGEWRSFFTAVAAVMA